MTEIIHETQETVSEWCDQHYPGFDAIARLLDRVEEVMELAAAMGIEKEVLFARAAQSWQKSQKDFGDPIQIPKEIGDIKIATYWLATKLKVDAQEALDRVMKDNRMRKPEEARARLLKKTQFFGTPPGAQAPKPNL